MPCDERGTSRLDYLAWRLRIFFELPCRKKHRCPKRWCWRPWNYDGCIEHNRQYYYDFWGRAKSEPKGN